MTLPRTSRRFSLPFRAAEAPTRSRAGWRLALTASWALALSIITHPAPAQVVYMGKADPSALTTVPSNSIGVDNSWYLDLLSGNVYGPKTVGQWPSSPVSNISPNIFSAANNILVAGPNGVGIRDSGLQLLKTYVGTVAPGASQDSTQGYSVGSSGVNTTNGAIYVAQSVTPSSAVWVLTSIPGLLTYTGATDPGATTDGAHGYSVGSMGINTTTGRTFMAKANTTNAAVWVALGSPIVYPQTATWYVARGQSPSAVSAAIGSTTTIALSPFFIGQPQTVNGLGTRITTGGSSNLQVGIYASDPTTGLPTGAVLVNTADIVDTGTGAVTASASNTQLSAGLYWAAIEANDTTVALLGPNSGVVAEYIGNASSGQLSSATSITDCLTAPTSAYGTWPNLTAASFTFVNTTSKCGLLLIRYASVP